MELSNYLVSWVVTYLGDLQPTYIGVIIYLLSSMDIPVTSWCFSAALNIRSFTKDYILPTKKITPKIPEFFQHFRSVCQNTKLPELKKSIFF